MPSATSSDEITILVATDNHVGYGERDSIRRDDSWKTFEEIIKLAKARDVDMILLAGDLFHENKPSRASMFHVMRILRENCLGDKPCELEMLSDATEDFEPPFDHVNYEDQDINVAIPVFSIHGNHDDPTGEGEKHYSALDLLQVAGLVNYYGRMPEADRVSIKPILLQKGRTKLALYGMSNVRDERLFRTFRDGKVKFFQPSTQKSDWFNLMSVHQNHHAHTATSYLPENFLPEFLDLIVWGHEHECLIDPRYNPEMSFHVMQPGSSVATSLMPGEAVPKHVALLKITGKEFKVEPIRLTSVRPFVMKEIVLAEERPLKNIWKKDNHRSEITRHLHTIVEELIEQARQEWISLQHSFDEETERNDKGEEVPRPLIRLRVEYTAPDGGHFDIDNPQRISNRFREQVANINDVVQFYRKKKSATRKNANDVPEMPDDAAMEKMEQMSLDSIKVEKLVKEFLTAQSLTILPQNTFGDAVSQFVDKDDKHSMEMFVDSSLTSQLKHLLNVEDFDEDGIADEMETYRSKLEELFAAGAMKKPRRTKVKPKPDTWDTDMDGDWEDQPGAIVRSEADDDDDDDESVATTTTTRGAGRGGGRGRGGRGGAATTRKPAAPKKATAPARGGRGKKKVVEEEDDDEESDVDMVLNDDEDEGESQPLFVKPATKSRAKAPTSRAASKAPAALARKAAAPRQSTLNFSQPSQPIQRATGRAAAAKKTIEISDDEISDDEDAFDPMPTNRTRR